MQMIDFLHQSYRRKAVSLHWIKEKFVPALQNSCSWGTIYWQIHGASDERTKAIKRVTRFAEDQMMVGSGNPMINMRKSYPYFDMKTKKVNRLCGGESASLNSGLETGLLH